MLQVWSIQLLCVELDNHFSTMGLPEARQNRLFCVDSGPGQGAKFGEVQLRCTQQALLFRHDYVAVITRAPRDSPSNEVETVNGTLSDSMQQKCQIEQCDIERYSKNVLGQPIETRL